MSSSPLQHLSSLNSLRQWRKTQHKEGRRVAFVPTMGNLHSGHLKLVREAQKLAEVVIVSIYVNPMQFGANEDLDSYPKTLEADIAALEALGVAAVFTPATAAMYPRGLAQQTFVEVPQISDLLCGASRPGHFRGVATVVCKLFNMVQPDSAVFGKKDYQQLMVIRAMVADLSLPVEVVGVDTEREPNGLAKSSRNGYLSASQKQQATVLYQQLSDAVRSLEQGETIECVEDRAQRAIAAAGLEPEYFTVRQQQDLQPAKADQPAPWVILAAARLGSTRLIDNLELAGPLHGPR